MKSITFNKKTKGLAAVVVGNRVVMVKSGKPVEVTVPDHVQLGSKSGMRISSTPLPQASLADIPAAFIAPSALIVPEVIEEEKVVGVKFEEPASEQEENVVAEAQEEVSPESSEERINRKKGKNKNKVTDYDKEGV
jgi:hypothetical protein